MKKFKCIFKIFIEEVIEEENKQLAEEEFWKRNDLSDLDIYLTIKEFRKKRK